jgi:PAS domain S-box-containing protein
MALAGTTLAVLSLPAWLLAGSLSRSTAWAWACGGGALAAGGLCLVFAWTQVLSRRRSRQNARIRDSEERFRLAFEDAADAILWADGTTGEIVRVNRAAERLFGCPREQLIGRHQTQLHPPEKREEYARSFARQVSSNGCVDEEMEILAADGQVHTVQITGAVCEVDGRKIVQGIFHDLSARKAIETALRLSEERFRLIIDSTSDCVIIWDRQYNYLYANQAAVHHVGITADQVNDRNIRDALGHMPEFMNLWMRRIDAAFSTGEAREYKDVFPVGERMVHSESIVMPVRDPQGRIYAAAAVYRDITEQRETEQALRSSEGRYRVLYDQCNDAVFLADLTGRITQVNRRACEMLESTPEELTGRNICELHPKEVLGGARQALQTARTLGAACFESQLLTRQGRCLEVEISAGIIEGEQRILQGVVRDITERKAVEQQNRKHIEEMERFNRLAVGRELRMIELKREVNEMARKAGVDPPYDLAFTNENGGSESCEPASAEAAETEA